MKRSGLVDDTNQHVYILGTYKGRKIDKNAIKYNENVKQDSKRQKYEKKKKNANIIYKIKVSEFGYLFPYSVRSNSTTKKIYVLQCVKI